MANSVDLQSILMEFLALELGVAWVDDSQSQFQEALLEDKKQATYASIDQVIFEGKSRSYAVHY